MTAREALDIIQNEYPFKDVTECREYSDKFIFALTSGDKVDYNSPYKAVDKETGKISAYSPVQDIANFPNGKIIDI